jgi:hypothetical protein
MGRASRVSTAVVLVILGATGAGWFLLGEGLDRAEKWVSIVGVCVSTAMSAAGLILAWLTFRQPRSNRGMAAPGIGAVAVGGNSGAEIRTDVSGIAVSMSSPVGGPVSGPGSVAVGGDSTAPISTRVTGPDSPQRP